MLISILLKITQLINGQFIVVGKVLPAGKVSIHWLGEIDNYGKYPPPGNYYIRIVNNATGQSDRSDASFSVISTVGIGSSGSTTNLASAYASIRTQLDLISKTLQNYLAGQR